MLAAAGWGVVLGMVFWRKAASDDPAPPPAPPLPIEIVDDSGASPLVLQRRADLLMWADAAQESATIYERLLEEGDLADVAELHYRLALCLERTGANQLAMTRFRQLSSVEVGGELAPFARLGLGRILFRRDEYPHARQTFASVAFDEHVPEVARGEALFLLGLTQAAEALQDTSDDPLLLDSCVRPPLVWTLPDLLELTPAPDPEQAPASRSLEDDPADAPAASDAEVAPVVFLDEGIRDQESGIRDQESGIRDQESGISGQESAANADEELPPVFEAPLELDELPGTGIEGQAVAASDDDGLPPVVDALPPVVDAPVVGAPQVIEGADEPPNPDPRIPNPDPRIPSPDPRSTSPEPPATGPPPATSSVILQFALSRRATEVQLQVDVDGPLTLTIARIAQAAEVRIEWSRAAQSIAAARNAACRADSLSLATLLDRLLDPLDLGWEQGEDDVIRVVEVAEWDVDRSHAFRQGIAERTLRGAVTALPSHRLAAEAYLALGNVALATGRLDEAAALYRQVVTRYPHTRVRTSAWFNLGKCEYRLRRLDSAMAAFFHVTDRAPGAALESAGYLYAGVAQIEAGPATAALRTLGRAAARAPEGDGRTAAVLTQASAMLLIGNAPAAHELLSEHRVALTDCGQRDEAAFLSALAKYEMSSEEYARVRAGRSLLESLTLARPERFLGRHGYLLIAEAFADLGLTPECLAACQDGLDNGASGDIGAALESLAARGEAAEGRTEAALERLRRIAAGGPADWPWRARLAECELLLDEERLDECLALGRTLLAEARGEPRVGALAADEAHAGAVLRVMGRAYRRLGDYHRASLCFAGLAAHDDLLAPPAAPAPAPSAAAPPPLPSAPPPAAPPPAAPPPAAPQPLAPPPRESAPRPAPDKPLSPAAPVASRPDYRRFPEISPP